MNFMHSSQPFYPTNQTQVSLGTQDEAQAKRQNQNCHSRQSNVPSNQNQSLNSEDLTGNIQNVLRNNAKQNNNSTLSVNNSLSSNCYANKPNYLSETATSQNLEDGNLSEASKNCASNLSQSNTDLNFTSNKPESHGYSPFNKSPFMLHEKAKTYSNNVGLLFNSMKCAEVKEELSEDEDIIESDY